LAAVPITETVAPAPLVFALDQARGAFIARSSSRELGHGAVDGAGAVKGAGVGVDGGVGSANAGAADHPASTTPLAANIRSDRLPGKVLSTR
jgi:hypothetical protein